MYIQQPTSVTPKLKELNFGRGKVKDKEKEENPYKADMYGDYQSKKRLEKLKREKEKQEVEAEKRKQQQLEETRNEKKEELIAFIASALLEKENQREQDKRKRNAREDLKLVNQQSNALQLKIKTTPEI